MNKTSKTEGFVADYAVLRDGTKEKGLDLILRPGGEILMTAGKTKGDFSALPSPRGGERIYLIGRLGDLPVRLHPRSHDEQAPPGLEWTPIRGLLGLLDADDFAFLTRAAMLASWDMDHRFCGRCGIMTQADTSEAARVCGDCGKRFYPRVSPAVILRVTDGSRILLARNRRFPEGLYSCMSGFVEPGETLEDSAHREVAEEVSLKIHHLRYLASQPWPFPHSLMLAMEAEALGDPIPDGEEIVDARWFSPDELPALSARGSIARWLIEDWKVQVR